MTGNIGRLVCGDYDPQTELGSIMELVQHNICNLADKIDELIEGDITDLSLYGPFLTRTLLESSCTALVGRIDPFRLLFLKKIQERSSFDLTSRSNSAIQWNGDIFEKGLSNKERQKMWNPKLTIRDINRGLLGSYYDEIFWRTAYEKILDETNELEVDVLQEYRANITTEMFLPEMRVRASEVFSALSKGVHSEIIIRHNVLFDSVSIKNYIAKAIGLCSMLGLVSHRIEEIRNVLDLNEALDLFIQVKERVDSYV